MAIINKQDTNGTKGTLARGELGYDNYGAGGDVGRVYVGTGTTNIPLAKKSEGALLGQIIPIASNLSGSYPIPSSGVVDSNGWMYCNGASIPSGKGVSGTTPNLSNGRFLRGTTSSGSTGGSDTFTLATANIPSHTHSTPNHSHTGSSSSAGSHSHSVSAKTDCYTYYGSNYFYTVRNGCGSHYTKSVDSAGAHSHTLTIASGGGGTTGSTGSTSAKSHIPKYVNVQYIIKVN